MGVERGPVVAGGDRRSGRRASTALPLPASSPDPRCALTEVKGHPSVSGDREKRDFGGAAAYGARKPERAGRGGQQPPKRVTDVPVAAAA